MAKIEKTSQKTEKKIDKRRQLKIFFFFFLLRLFSTIFAILQTPPFPDGLATFKIFGYVCFFVFFPNFTETRGEAKKIEMAKP